MQEIDYEQSLDLDFRKREGIFYSPNRITRFMVEDIFADFTEFERLPDLKILDPSCGTGAFLLEIFDFVLVLYQKHLPKFENSEKWIVENNLYGVDLDENAVQICQKRLFEKSGVPSQNIKIGNSLISNKTVDHRAFEWENEFSLGKFDLIVGNPPYFSLSTQTDHFLNYYQEKYEVFERTSDIYCLFFEKGFELLKPKGKLCFITSNQWLQTNYGKKLRNWFISKADPQLLVNFGGVKVFKDATVDSAVFLLQKQPCCFRLKACELPNEFLLGTTKIGEYVHKNTILLTDLQVDRWVIADLETLQLKEKIRQVGSFLKNWNVKINYGIKTGLNEAFIIDEKTRNKLVAKDSKSAEILVPVLRGRDVHQYYAEWANLYLVLTKNGIDISQYPAVFKHLKSFGKAIKERADQGENWWNLRACAYYDSFLEAKIIYPETTVRRSEFYLDTKGTFLDKTCFMITGEDLAFLNGVLSSSLLEWYLETELRSLGKNSIQYSKQYMENVPLPKKENIDPQLYTKIADLTEKLTEIRNVSSPKNEVSEQFESLKNELDRMVFELYEVSETDREAITKGLK